MTDKILLNEEEYKVNESDLPSLVTYGEHSGGSHYTITMVAQLFLQGSKILFLTAYPMAKDNFLKQVGDDHSNIAFVNSVDDFEKAKNTQCIMLESGNEVLFTEALKVLPDLKDRVILIKNIEKFSMSVFEKSLDLEKIILSGHLDECVAKNEIIKKSFSTTVIFTKTEIDLGIKVPELPKWSGFFTSIDKNGITKIINP